MIVVPFPFLVQQVDARVEQIKLQAGEIRSECLATTPQLIGVLDQQRMAVAIGDERRQQLDLALRLEHRFVRAVQVIEVADQCRDAWHHIERLQHVTAYKVGQITDRLHRHGLVKQFERLLVFDSEAAAKPGAIRRKAIKQLSAGSTKLFSQRGDVGSEVCKVGSYGEVAFRPHEEARGLALRILHPEHLRDGDGLVIASVVEHAKDDAVAVVVAQRNRLGRATHLVALGFVVTEHIGTQRALFVVGTRRLVVCNAMRGHQQRRHRIHQGRFSRADVAS